MASAVLLIVVLLIIAAIVHAVTGESRYARMTEEEFEQDAQRGSRGGALMEIQRIVQGKKVEYMMQQDKREEGDSAESGDKSTGSDS